MRFLVITLLLLTNAFDAVATDYVLTRQLGTELNPLMAALYGYSPFAFLGYKAFATAAFMFVVAKYWNISWIRTCAYCVTFVFLCLTAYTAAVFF